VKVEKMAKSWQMVQNFQPLNPCKDVECFFGRLKKLFRVLRVPSPFQDKKHVARIFKFCAAIHNMLLEHDGIAAIGSDEDDWITRHTKLIVARRANKQLHKYRHDYRGEVGERFENTEQDADVDFSPMYRNGVSGNVEQVTTEKILVSTNFDRRCKISVEMIAGECHEGEHRKTQR